MAIFGVRQSLDNLAKVFDPNFLKDSDSLKIPLLKFLIQTFFKKFGAVKGAQLLAPLASGEIPFALEARLLFLILFLFRKKGREKEYCAERKQFSRKSPVHLAAFLLHAEGTKEKLQKKMPCPWVPPTPVRFLKKAEQKL